MPKSILKSNEEVAMLLMTRAAKSAAGKRVAATVLARIELAIAEAELAREMAEAAKHAA